MDPGATRISSEKGQFSWAEVGRIDYDHFKGGDRNNTEWYELYWKERTYQKGNKL